MKTYLNFITILFVLFFGLSATALNVTASLNKKGVILEGYDPVAYFKQNKAVLGNEKYQTKLDGITYWFSSDLNKNDFTKDPVKYQPQFGGWCAYAVADSKSKVESDPKKFVIQDGKLLVFYDGFFGDTRDKWLNTKNKDPKKYLTEAEANWPQVKTTEP